jgi:hypothetical protein
LNLDDMGFKRLLPRSSCDVTAQRAGYRTHAMVSMPVLNPFTAINRDFDSFELMPSTTTWARCSTS